MFIFKFIKLLIKAVLVLFGILPFFRCSSGYRDKDGKVTFDGREITDKNFVVLNRSFAKDSTTAYYKSKAFQYADVPSFEALDDHYAKDKNKVYYCEEDRNGQDYYLTKRQIIKEIELAIPASFVLLGSGYAKDNQHAFFIDKAFSVKDVASFEMLNISFSKDKVQAYLDTEPIAGSDGKSFRVLDAFYAKDAAHVYFFAVAGTAEQRVSVLPCDAANFAVLDYPYSKDAVAVFYEGKKIAGADAGSFTVLGDGYAKDQHAIYFESKQIVGADAASFELYKENETVTADFFYAKDKTSVYLGDKKIPGADVASFKILTLGYGMDNHQVFYKISMVKNAQVASFKTYPHGYGEEDAEDAANKYLAGKKVAKQ